MKRIALEDPIKASVYTVRVVPLIIFMWTRVICLYFLAVRFILEYLFLVGQNVLSKVLSFGFRLGRHKTGWTAAENHKRLEISD